MILEHGPDGKRHFPSYTNGCYYRRMSDSCWLCTLRVATGSTLSPISYWIREAHSTSEHELVGTEIVVPMVERSFDSSALDYREGKIVEVHILSGDDPDILTVNTEGDELVHVHINLTAAQSEI